MWIEEYGKRLTEIREKLKEAEEKELEEMDKNDIEFLLLDLD